MDNSQSLKYFSHCPVSIENVYMDTACYKSLVCSTKKALQYGLHSEIKRSTFTPFFRTLLEDCRSCISQSFDLINDMLSNSNVNMDKLIGYINDSVSLLQMLSDFIKTVIELVAVSCIDMKTFPTTTGQIIRIVFLHCKESDSIYGIYLSHVAMHLKDLFRTCHELQLTYLMVLEKHFVFDLSESEQLVVLDAALEINLEIGEIVENLDVKTMAEQWKAYTALNEKYCCVLKDKPIYNKCTKVLCQIIENNINTTSEHSQEDKVMLRSVKVASFMIKILLKIIGTFKQPSSLKQQDLILDLLINFYLKSYLYSESEKFTNLMHTNVLCSIEMLLKELLLDQTFVNCLLNYEINKIIKEDKLFGYILLLVSVMKVVIQFENDTPCISKQKIICCVYSCLPYCHVWFNMGVKFSSKSTHYVTEGLYENALTYMVAFAMTLNTEEYGVLEKNMVESLLSTDCISALFSSNLWTLLARFHSQLAMNQLISLCKIYRNCEGNVFFNYSPQKVHLSYTIGRLFEVLKTGDKIKVYNEVSSCNNTIPLLPLLNTQSLPDHLRISIEDKAGEKLKLLLRKLTSDLSLEIEEIKELINYMDMVALHPSTHDYDLAELVMKAWTKACFDDGTALIQGDLDGRTLWFIQYIRALVSLTNSRRQDFYEPSGNIVKVLHILLKMAKSRSIELKLILFDFFFYLLEKEVYDGNKNNIDHLTAEIIKYLAQSTDEIVKSKLLCSFKTLRQSNIIDKMLNIFGDDNQLKEIWGSCVRRGFRYQTSECKAKLMKVSDVVYIHKCIKDKDLVSQNVGNDYKHDLIHSSGNFDLADDIDTIFENESESEPVCKKPKYNNNDDGNGVDVIVAKLENYVSELGKVKENILTVEQKLRIRVMCDRLKIISNFLE